ncbi:NAD(P)H:quinone oxidoreductase [Aliikangiella marina]|uniref:NAD(P)H:quinone oxidoreductase n=1 Tax=Aliikangiella marina TaxID=1712262 RepID=A0A545TIR5_9GAMM|nr:NAD(P)H:quinone oxidoreductase [Aliikangiella marina]TQV77071.1 NAD(P)H:quinone oxidoreductase [Aliikangiella marina]
MPKVLVLYYSQSGHTQKLAKLIARGIEEQGCEAVIRTVPGVSPKNEAVDSAIPESGDLYATKLDLIECDGLVVGSPTRFGNMAAALKYFIDGTSEIWMGGKLADKPVSFFTSTSSLHGGQESTLLSMMNPFLHHGMLVCGLPYSETELIHTESGGTPYGVSHWSGKDNDKSISDSEKALAIAQGKRIAKFTQLLA